VRGRSTQLRLSHVDVPRDIPDQAAVFIFLRKMRGPLMAVLAVTSLASVGLCLIPGPSGAPPPTAFQAFYFITFTATTIGFGEIPYVFSTAQRMWVIATVYTSVLIWAYAVARLMTLSQDASFASARRAATFRRKVRHLREPFILVLGYGFIGRSVVRALDVRGRRVVVVDRVQSPIERLGTDNLTTDSPSYTGDARNPAILGVAGLNHPDCEAVLALTGDDETNLQVVMACRLLRPELPVLARVSTRRVAAAMENFKPSAVVNAFDDYGRFLLLSLHRPHTYRLITWLMSETGAELPPLPTAFPLKRWLIVSDGQFGDDITEDLAAEGHDIRRIDASEATNVELDEVDALVCGAESDATNLALAAHARQIRPEIYLVVRVMSHDRLPLLEAFKPDSVFFPPSLITQQVLVHLVNPRYWRFLNTVMGADDAWSRDVTERLAARVTTKSPVIQPLTISPAETPAVSHWLEHGHLTLGDLFRSPHNREVHIGATTLLLARGHKRMLLPDESTPLLAGDELVIAGHPQALRNQIEVTYDDSTLYYVVTGQNIPSSWIGRALTKRRREAVLSAAGDLADQGDGAPPTATGPAKPAGAFDPVAAPKRRPVTGPAIEVEGDLAPLETDAPPAPPEWQARPLRRPER
jgi:Trk K+ transport system NAD-binding subunit